MTPTSRKREQTGKYHPTKAQMVGRRLDAVEKALERVKDCIDHGDWLGAEGYALELANEAELLHRDVDFRIDSHLIAEAQRVEPYKGPVDDDEYRGRLRAERPGPEGHIRMGGEHAESQGEEADA